MSDRAAVLFVNEAFYEAFRACDMETMDHLWSREAPVACIHPGWRALTTRAEVMDSWRDILSSEGVPDVACRGAQAFLTGETAYVICYEVIGGGVLVATNIYRKEQGSWRLIHHQAGPCDLPTEAIQDEDEFEEGAIQ
ncbi:MAG: nuclear transport factor 2 family protein [Rhodospirillales bacterium]|nr:nuclear transport factor 2 family protein [Rhodospirillales bacterium]MDH3912398.1 nuclear transport factor 2 family protein [Rhodospirillales bacterium]MDH3918991.1 nuclear transport factor 2 family protein [Rhodospirillales bacterium]MDH3969766.1 nuclear transport factor 2 family protein [Rhodospirillales bacterium]